MSNQQIINEVISVLVVPMLPIVTTYLVTWMKAKTELLKAQTKSQTIQHYAGMLDKVVEDVVLGLSQTTVEELKKTTEDGKLDSKDAEAIKNKAINEVSTILTQDAKDILKQAYGDVDALISEKIEASVKKSKSA